MNDPLYFVSITEKPRYSPAQLPRRVERIAAARGWSLWGVDIEHYTGETGYSKSTTSFGEEGARKNQYFSAGDYQADSYGSGTVVTTLYFTNKADFDDAVSVAFPLDIFRLRSSGALRDE